MDSTEDIDSTPVEARQDSQSLLTHPSLGSYGGQASAATHAKVDAIQAAVERMPQVELPLTHRFTPGSGSATGMYIRTIFMPKGALVISKIHRTQHPFVVTKGRCMVWDRLAPGPPIEIRAGHIGITMPGTRRILYIYEDTEWTTFHATDKTTPEAVEADIIEPHDFDREEALAHFAQLHGQLTESPERADDSSQGSSPTPGGRPPLVTAPETLPLTSKPCEA